MTFKKILITAPTSSNKNYCLEEYLLNVSRIEYPNFKLVLFDNTVDSGENILYVNSTIKRLFGNDDRFVCIKSDIAGCEGLISRMCKSMNEARLYAIDNGYDAALWLESDVMIQPHFLQELIIHKKPVVGALYYRGEGKFRKLMVQQRVHRAPNNVFMDNADQQFDVSFIDGTLKEAGHIGLGCVLIDVKVLNKIPFRYNPNVPLHSDSYWAEDLYQNKIKVWVDTALIAEHKNQNWDLQVYNKNNKA